MTLKHLSWRSKQGYRPPVVPEAWLGITSQANLFVNKVSRVPGLAVKVAPGAAADSQTAQYMPALSLIEVDSDRLLPGVKPEEVLFTDPLFPVRYPLFHGALSHESAHARYTRLLPADLAKIEGLTDQMIDVLVLLEESRIEKRMLADTPSTKAFLPALVWDFLGKDVQIGDTPYSAAALAALLLARADAGSITWKAAQPFKDLILTVLDQATLDTLRGLWCEYHALPFWDNGDKHAEAQISIATRWLEALGIDPEAAPSEMIAMSMPGEGAEGAGEGAEGSEGAGSSQGAGEESEGSEGSGEGTLGDKAAQAAREAAAEAEGKAAEKIGQIKFDQRAQERDADRTRHAEGKKAAKRAFPPGHGATESGVSLVEHRAPTAAERAAATHFSKYLGRVLWTDRNRTKFNTDRPGGRLRGRGAVMRSAQKASGMRPTAPQWRQVHREVVDEPRIRLGFMTDISGSMSDAVRPMGAAAYIVGRAVNDFDGTFASVTFAERVYGIVRPGQTVRDVPVMEANGGWENFKQAFHALDEVIDLIDGDGLRILVLATDGVYGAEGQKEAASTAMRLCVKRGVVPIHLDFTGKIHYYDATYGSRLGLTREPIRIHSGTAPQEVARLIGEAVVTEVAHWKAKHGVTAA